MGQEDYDDLVSLMALAFYFNWGLWVLSSNGKRAIYAHHDEIVWVLAATTESLDGETLGWLDALTEPF